MTLNLDSKQIPARKTCQQNNHGHCNNTSKKISCLSKEIMCDRLRSQQSTLMKTQLQTQKKHRADNTTDLEPY